MDRACQLEAMLLSLSNRRRELRLEQSRANSHFIRLMSELQASLQGDEDLTVILADTFAYSLRNIDSGIEVVEEEKKVPDAASAPADEGSGDDDDPGMRKPPRLDRPATPPNSISRNFGCFANQVLQSFDDHEGLNLRLLSSVPCGAAGLSQVDEPPVVSSSTWTFPMVSNPSPSEARAGARAWRELHGCPERSGVNFRTGMSGHMGLLSTHSRSHEFLADTRPASFLAAPQTEVAALTDGRNMRLSAHTGLTVTRSRGNL